MRRSSAVVSVLSVVALAMAGCSRSDDDSSSEPPPEGGVCDTTDASGDMLAEICDEGTISVSTDPRYPPQSALNEQTGEFEGFDIDVTEEIAKRMGVEVEWVTPS